MMNMLCPDWKTELFTFDVQVSNETFKGFVDTGSDDAVITEDAYERIEELIFPITADVKTFDRAEEDKIALPVALTELEFFGLKRYGPLILARGYFKNLEEIEILIGRRHLKNVVITIDSEESINIVEKSPKRSRKKSKGYV